MLVFYTITNFFSCCIYFMLSLPFFPNAHFIFLFLMLVLFWLGCQVGEPSLKRFFSIWWQITDLCVCVFMSYLKDSLLGLSFAFKSLNYPVSELYPYVFKMYTHYFIITSKSNNKNILNHKPPSVYPFIQFKCTNLFIWGYFLWDSIL